MKSFILEIAVVPVCLLRALRTLLSSGRLLGLAIIPYVVGLFVYISTLFGAFTIRNDLAAVFVSTQVGIEAVGWMVFLGSILAAGLVALILVLLCSALLMEWFVEEGLRKAQLLAERKESFWSSVCALIRVLFDSSLQLLVVFALTVLALLLSAIPVLSLFVALLASFVLGYQLFDFSLSLLRYRFRERLRLILQHKSQVLVLGLLFSLALLVPFGGILLLPILYLMAIEKLQSWRLTPSPG